MKIIKGNYIILYLNKSNACINGNKTYISSDSNVVPLIYCGKLMLPFEFSAKHMNLNAVCDGNIATFSRGGVDRPICLIKLNGGELYADALELTGLAGWFLKFEQNGLIFITSEDNSGILDWASNSRYLSVTPVLTSI